MLGQATGLGQKRVGKAIPSLTSARLSYEAVGIQMCQGLGGWKEMGPECVVRGALSRKTKEGKECRASRVDKPGDTF